MSLIKEVKSMITGQPVFDNAIFLKKDSDAKIELAYLESLVGKDEVKDQDQLLQAIKKLKYGIYGEDKIEFELANSHIPMVVLHDIRLEYDGLTAQIDYLIIARRNTYIIECKNLYGNIEINNKGDFIRWINKRPEGIYSPITQNQRHKELIKKLRKSEKKNLFLKIGFEKYFDDWHKTLVVLANDKTYVKDRYAPKDIKNQIIKADQLVSYIKNTEKKNNDTNLSEADMKKLGEFYLKHHHPKHYDYSYLLDEVKNEADNLISNESQTINDNPTVNDDTTLYNELRKYRLNKSRSDNVQPYIIFNNNQLDELVFNMPTTIEQLANISGFAQKRCENYGHDIIDIIKIYKGIK